MVGKEPRTSKFRAASLPEGGLPEGEWIILFSDDLSALDQINIQLALGQINNWRKHNNLPLLAGEDPEKCERAVGVAVRSVKYLKEIALFVTPPKRCKATFEAEARKRRKAAELLSGEARRLLEEEAAAWERRAAVKQPRIGAKAREQAVDLAYQLLEHFGGKAPGLSRAGPWVRLSKILFDEPGANMFEAVRRSPRLGCVISDCGC
jgi:hypothetical protein